MSAQRGEPAKGEEACATPGCGHLRGAHLWPRHGGMECTKGDGCTKFTRPTEDAQRGDFVSPPASSPTDRRDADDAEFAAELARLDGLPVADVAADVREADLLHQLRMLTAERDALDRAVTEEIAERDRLHDIADRLAYAIAPMEVIGEHSSMNDPWANALEVAALKPAPGTDAATVPTNAELAERARGLDAHTVVRGWLDRHVGQVPVGGFDTRDDWLDWAASNFLADPEIAQRLTPAAPGTDSSGQAVQRDETTNGLHIGDLTGVLHVSQMAPGHWEQYRVNEHTIDWRYVVDGPTAVAGPQRDHDEEGA